jgi:polyisoprenoid-binding protein YceI
MSWHLDRDQSWIGFLVRHLVVGHLSGRFARFEACLPPHTREPALGALDLRIEVASLDTGVPERDAWLLGLTMLDAARYPHIEFRARRAEPEGDLFQLLTRVVGTLTIRDLTRQVTLEFERIGRAEGPAGEFGQAFEIRGTLDRWRWRSLAGWPMLGRRVSVDARLLLIDLARFPGGTRSDRTEGGRLAHGG